MMSRVRFGILYVALLIVSFDFFSERNIFLIFSAIDDLNIDFPINSNAYLVEENEGTYEINTIYRPLKNTSYYIKQHISTWTINGFILHKPYSIFENRSNLMGTKLISSYVVLKNKSREHWTDYRHLDMDNLSRTTYLILRIIYEIMNATAGYYWRDTWGYLDQNHTEYTGMLGDIVNNRADISGTTAFLTLDRLQHFQFVAVTSPTYIRFIFRDPPLPESKDIYYLPFDLYTWLAIIPLVFLIYICFYFIVYVEDKIPLRQKQHTNSLKSEVLIAEMEILLLQGISFKPKTMSSKTVVVVSSFMVLFLYTSYSANLVALLQSSSDNINTLEDLLNSNIKLAAEDVLYSYFYFKNATDPVSKAIYTKKITPKGEKPHYILAEEGIKKVQNEFFGFHTEETTAYAIIERTFEDYQKCDLKRIKFMPVDKPYLALPKNSPLRGILNIAFDKLREQGILKRELVKMSPQTPKCDGKISRFSSVSGFYCRSVIILFIMGIIISICIFFIEVSIAYTRRPRFEFVN